MTEKSELKFFPRLILRTVKALTPEERWQKLYLKFMNIINYAIVCGIGVGINMYILHGLVNMFPLWIANLCAIITSFLWNWTFSVGPFGYLWGFSAKPKTTKKETKGDG